MKAPAEFGQICSVGRRKIAKKIAKNKRCYANTLRPTRLPVATFFLEGGAMNFIEKSPITTKAYRLRVYRICPNFAQ